MLPETNNHHDTSVKPGITGLAQVAGRNQLSWPKRLALDLEYVDRVSIVLDVKILMKTIFKVLRREGIVSEGYVSSAPFLGQMEDDI